MACAAVLVLVLMGDNTSAGVSRESVGCSEGGLFHAAFALCRGLMGVEIIHDNMCIDCEVILARRRL